MIPLCWEHRAPLRANNFLDRRDARNPRSVEQITIGPMLQRVSPRITPIVEDLAPQHMAPDAPFVTASFCMSQS